MNLKPYHFVSAPGLTWEAVLKMTKVKLEWNRGGICHVIN